MADMEIKFSNMRKVNKFSIGWIDGDNLGNVKIWRKDGKYHWCMDFDSGWKSWGCKETLRDALATIVTKLSLDYGPENVHLVDFKDSDGLESSDDE